MDWYDAKGECRRSLLSDELRRDYPNNSLIKLYWLPTIDAAVQLQASNPSAVLMELETAAPNELGVPPPMQTGLSCLSSRSSLSARPQR
jgi:hypothetical protein